MKSVIEMYIENQEQVIKDKLFFIHNEILKTFDNIGQKISYGIPTYHLKKNIFHFAAYQNHIGIYPGPSVVEMFKNKFKNCKFAKGTIQIPNSIDFPKDDIKEIINYIKNKNL